MSDLSSIRARHIAQLAGRTVEVVEWLYQNDWQDNGRTQEWMRTAALPRIADWAAACSAHGEYKEAVT